MKAIGKMFAGILVYALIVLLFVACDTEQEAGLPWEGYEVKRMSDGGLIDPISGISNSKAGKVWWYYINAEEGESYSISMSPQMPAWMKNDASRASQPASAVMTGYKEDGTVFGSMNPRDDGNYFNTPITYHSDADQKLYISFKFLTAGYLAFYY